MFHRKKKMSYIMKTCYIGCLVLNAELLIDHAWGYEPCTMEMVKAYKPENEQCLFRAGTSLPL